MSTNAIAKHPHKDGSSQEKHGRKGGGSTANKLTRLAVGSYTYGDFSIEDMEDYKHQRVGWRVTDGTGTERFITQDLKEAKKRIDGLEVPSGMTGVTVMRMNSERPCLHPNCAILHAGTGTWDGVDHIVDDNYWRVVDSDTMVDLYGDVSFDTKREAMSWAKEHYPDFKPTVDAPRKPKKAEPPPPSFDDLTQFQQSRKMGMLGSEWAQLPEDKQRQLWAAAKITKHAATGAGGTHPGTGTGQDVHGSGGGGSPTSGVTHEATTANLPDETAVEMESGHRVPDWFTGKPAPDGHWWVSKDNVDTVVNKLGVLSRRAEKHGLDPFTHEVVDTHTQTVEESRDGKTYESVREWSLVKVTGNPPKFEGWEFAGRIEHLPANEGDGMFNVLHMRPDLGTSPPSKYRDSGPDCDVCQRNVYRKDTFLVHNSETNEWKQVGRDDLKLFTGERNPAADMAYLKVWDSMEGDDGFDEFFDGGDAWKNRVIADTGTYLVGVAAEVRMNGYVSASSLTDQRGNRFSDGRVTTAEIVSDTEYHKTKFVDNTPVPTDGDLVEAEAALAHYKGYETPEGVNEFREFQARLQSKLGGEERAWGWDTAEQYDGQSQGFPPNVEQYSPGSHHWREGGGSEDYARDFNEWKSTVHGSKFDPTSGADLKQQNMDGFLVEQSTASQSVMNKRVRDLVKAQSNDDFMMNMKAAASFPMATASTAGILAYAIPGYQRHQAAVKLAAIKAAQPKSQWVGTPKKREVFTNLTIEQVKTGDGTYGTWHLTKLRDPSGNSFTTWYGGDGLFVPDRGAPDPYPGESATRLWKPGDVITAKATVKEHTVDAYADNEYTTVIQRLAGVVLEEEE